MRPLTMVLAVAMVASVLGVAVCQDTRPARVFGTLVKVDGAKLVVNARQRGGEAKEVTVTTDEKTKFTLDAEAGKLADLKAEMRVFITMVAGSTDKAASVSATSKNLGGTVVKVDGTNLVVRVRQRGADAAEAKEVTVATDDKTKVLIRGPRKRGEPRPEAKPGKLADLKAGMRVQVIPPTGTATKIIASPARRRRGS